MLQDKVPAPEPEFKLTSLLQLNLPLPLWKAAGEAQALESDLRELEFQLYLLLFV